MTQSSTQGEKKNNKRDFDVKGKTNGSRDIVQCVCRVCAVHEEVQIQSPEPHWSIDPEALAPLRIAKKSLKMKGQRDSIVSRTLDSHHTLSITRRS